LVLDKTDGGITGVLKKDLEKPQEFTVTAWLAKDRVTKEVFILKGKDNSPPIWLFILLLILLCLLIFCCCQKKEEETYTQLVQEPPTIPLIFEVNGDDKRVNAIKDKPFGTRFNAEFPLMAKGIVKGHAKELGVQAGWILKSVDGVDVTGAASDWATRSRGLSDTEQQEFKRIDKILKEKLGDGLLFGTPIEWNTPNGIKTVWAIDRPLGVPVGFTMPLTVTEAPHGHGEVLGIKIGWVLHSISGQNVEHIAGNAEEGRQKVIEVLKKEIDLNWNHRD